jgi:hypothetical protein
MVVVEGATVPRQTGDTTMFVLGILASFAAIAAMCWLLFNLAVFALPFLVGLHTSIWAYGTGAGWLGAILFGGFAAGLTLAIGQALIILVRPLWARFVIALIFLVPAVLAGFYATLGITKTIMPSETWQMIFAVIGAGVVGVSAFLRIAGMAADSSDGSAVGT